MKPTIRDSEDTMSSFGRRKIALDKGLRPTLLAVMAVGGLLLGAPPASAGTIEGNFCMDTLYAPANGGKTTHCASEDVRIAGVQSVSPSSCTAGTLFDLTATYRIVTGAVQRYDIGIYFDINGDPEGDGALTGTCALTTLPTTPTPPFRNFDGDFCGDSTSAAPSPLLFTFTMTDVLCSDPDGNGSLDLPFATAWGNSAGPVCASETGAFPQSGPKCKTGIQSFPVEVELVDLDVTKEADPTEVDEPGGSIDYTVTVTNPALVVHVTLTTIVDDPDNDPQTSNSTTYQAADICADTDLGPGESTTCTFTRNVSGNPGDTFTDQACVSGTDSNTPPNPVGPTCATAVVAIKDVLPTATLEKTAQEGVCVVERYQVKVNNTSTTESLTLSSLNDDKFGDITALSEKVFGTTCGVDGNAGLGTLAGVPGAGALGTIDTSSSYTCQFDGLICDGEGVFPHVDTVTGTLSDNDNNTIEPTGDATVNGLCPATP